MRTFFVSYVSALVSLSFIDGVWLTIIAKPFYTRSLQHLLAPHTSWPPAILFYLFYPIAISLLVVLPQLKTPASLPAAFGYGCLLGFTAYAAYDLTNLATLKSWPIPLSIVDMAWGAGLTGLVSVIATLAVKRWG